MKKIYILLMHTNTIPSKIIRFFTRYKYTHVSISLNQECDEIYSFGRKNVRSILHSGFVKEKKTGLFFQKFSDTDCQIYEISVSDKSFLEINRVLNEMTLNKEQYKYDFIGLIPRFFGIPIILKNHYVCSFFVAEVLEKAKVIRLPKKACLIHPKDFIFLEKLKKIYEGKYLSYQNDEEVKI